MVTAPSSALSRHTAKPAIAGYMYQLQQALLKLFELDEGQALGIEVLDDIHVQQGDSPTGLIQVKNNTSGRKRLTNQSLELWKTLAIWASAVADKSLDLDTVSYLMLLTRSMTVKGSVADMISKRVDPPVIIAKMRAISPPMAEEARRAYEQVMGLEIAVLEALINRVIVLSGQSSLATTHDLVRPHLRRRGFPEQHFDEATRDFYGWLWEKVVALVESPEGIFISEGDVYQATRNIRDRYTSEKLPLRYADADETDFSTAELAGQENAMYIRQLDLVGANSAIKRRAILAYFRANSERTEWLSRGNVMPVEIRTFDRELIERWQPRFDKMCCNVKPRTRNSALQQMGLEHYLDLQGENIPFRSQLVLAYLTQGSFQILADNRRVWWHPKFTEVLL